MPPITFKTRWSIWIRTQQVLCLNIYTTNKPIIRWSNFAGKLSWFQFLSIFVFRERERKVEPNLHQKIILFHFSLSQKPPKNVSKLDLKNQKWFSRETKKNKKWWLHHLNKKSLGRWCQRNLKTQLQLSLIYKAKGSNWNEFFKWNLCWI